MPSQRTRRTLAVALLIISIWMPSVVAQTGNGSLTILVTDKDGTALPGATLSIRRCKCSSCGDSECSCCPAAITVVADKDGKFTIATTPGEYEVVAELDGYSKTVRSVTVAAGQEATVTLTLSSGGDEVINPVP